MVMKKKLYTIDFTIQFEIDDTQTSDKNYNLIYLLEDFIKKAIREKESSELLNRQIKLMSLSEELV